MRQNVISPTPIRMLLAGPVSAGPAACGVRSRGGNLETGANAGDGRSRPLKNAFIRRFKLDAQEERADLIAFLNNLTDTQVLEDPAHLNPFSD